LLDRLTSGMGAAVGRQSNGNAAAGVARAASKTMPAPAVMAALMKPSWRESNA
jgi:hypothetical protein